MYSLKNLTPHPVNVLDEDGNILRSIEPEGIIPRVAQNTRRIGEVDGIPLTRSEFGELENLPDQEEGVFLIVSLITAKAAKELGRDDCLIVNEAVRDDNGRIIGCRSLARL